MGALTEWGGVGWSGGGWGRAGQKETRDLVSRVRGLHLLKIQKMQKSCLCLELVLALCETLQQSKQKEEPSYM